MDEASDTNDVTIGVLGLQGDYEAHCKALERAGANWKVVRTAAEVLAVDGLILPGGESTTVGKLMVRHEVDGAIRERAERGMPVYGTCAGLILMAREIQGSDQFRLGLMDIEVARNAFGRQVDSFEADIDMPLAGQEPVRGVFIRAPFVTATGPEAEPLAEFDGKVVAVRQGDLLGTAFHPELTDDARVHTLFVEMVRKAKRG